MNVEAYADVGMIVGSGSKSKNKVEVKVKVKVGM